MPMPYHTTPGDQSHGQGEEGLKAAGPATPGCLP
uniref:Uncharacterized protein n=1 Tax=Arundo donax TaxID=35708 RepID=A0A0A9B1J8_ARUDO